MWPSGQTVLGDNRLYLADVQYNVVRAVDVTTGAATVVAGNGTFYGSASGDALIDPGDGGPATDAPMSNPSAVALDPAGNLYILDFCSVRRVDRSGIITTVAGPSAGLNPSPPRCGYGGDGGPATAALLGEEGDTGIGYGPGGLYIGDVANCRVRRVDGAGIITTVAGTGACATFGDGGQARNAGIDGPGSVVFDAAGNMYIAELGAGPFGLGRIRRVDHATGIITTVAGGGSPATGVGDGGPATKASLDAPRGLALDAANHLYIGDNRHFRVRRVDLAARPPTITTVAGTGQPALGVDINGGLATKTRLGAPEGVAVDVDSTNLYIVDRNLNQVRKVTGGIITAFAGNGSKLYGGDGGPATNAQLGTSLPAVTTDTKGDVYIADLRSSRIRRIDRAGVLTTVAGRTVGTDDFGGFSGDGGPATNALLNFPTGVAVDTAFNLFIADQGNCRVRRVDAATGVITTVAGTGTLPDLSCGFSGDGGPAGAAQVAPESIAFDRAGDLYLAGGCRLRRVDPAGVITTVAGTGACGYSGDGGAALSAQLSAPINGLIVDGAGNVVISDGASCAVRKVAFSSGPATISTVAGTGVCGYSGDNGPARSAQLEPQGIALDPAGNLFLADGIDLNHGGPGHCAVRKVDATGTITSVVGSGICGFAGDGGLATSAQLDQPHGLALSGGALYIGDSENIRVRRVLLTSTTGPAAAGPGHWR